MSQAALQQHPTGPMPSLGSLKELTQADLLGVNATLLEYMQGEAPLIAELAGHVIAAGGKRLRPMLTLAAAKLCDYKGDQHVHLAATVEFIHTATLLHDDVIDESNLRRGRKTANAVWGNQAPVLVGDFLFSRAFQLMVGSGNLKVLKILSDAAARIAEGEIMQLQTLNDLSTTQQMYLDVVSAKTAALFSAATEVGAVIAEECVANQKALYDFGDSLGMAFQILDDVLDYSAKQGELGKSIGDDFAECKSTLPVILAYAQSSPEEKEFWHRTIEKGDQAAPDLATAMSLIAKYEVVPVAMEMAQSYGTSAKQALSVFKESPAKTALLDTVDFCLSRRF